MPLTTCESPAIPCRRLGGALQSLNVQKCTGIDDISFGTLIAAMPGLRTLRIGWCFRLSPRALSLIASVPGLTCLDLAHTQIDDTVLAALADALPRLRELNLRGCALSERGLARCKPFTKLEVLSLRTCEVGNGAVEALIQMPRLRDLDLAYTELTDPGLLALAPLTNLQSLSLDSCRLTASGLLSVARFKRLHTLDLSDVEAPRFSVEVLASLPHLTRLNLFYVRAHTTHAHASPNCPVPTPPMPMQVGIGDHQVIHLGKVRPSIATLSIYRALSAPACARFNPTTRVSSLLYALADPRGRHPCCMRLLTRGARLDRVASSSAAKSHRA